MKKKRRVLIVSLGCFRNQYDSEVVAARIKAGKKVFLPVEEIGLRGDYDLLIVNTCGFIDPAKIESLEAINQAIDLKNQKKVKEIYVFGCLVARFQKELKKNFPEVDKWWGIEEFSKTYRKRLIQESPVDFIKICEGCINRCTYCAIPLIKGSLKSRPASEVLKEVERLENSGVKELNVIGQDITSWGKDFKKPKDLTYLLKRILKETKKIDWIRLIYTHPEHLTDEFIELIAKEERICDYIDLPIQHINRRILKLMGRRPSAQSISSLLDKIRKKIPGCAIRTSVIAGFPSETENEFKQLLDFIKEAKFDKLGAFIYSREEKTKAAKLTGQIHYKTKEWRRRQIMELQQEISAQKLKRFVGKEIKVLVTGKNKDFYTGRTQYDAPEVDGLVFIKKKKGPKVGQFYQAQVTDSLEHDLVAR